MHWILKFIFGMKLYCLRAGFCSQAVSKPVWHIPLLCVQWKNPDDGQRNCPKRVEFHSKNKFEKSVHLVGFIIRNLSGCTVTWTSDFKNFTYILLSIFKLIKNVIIPLSIKKLFWREILTKYCVVAVQTICNRYGLY